MNKQNGLTLLHILIGIVLIGGVLIGALLIKSKVGYSLPNPPGGLS